MSPRGEGNVVSLEFNLLYRWHAALSERDTAWTEKAFTEYFGTTDFNSVRGSAKLREFVLTNRCFRSRWISSRARSRQS